MGNFTLADGLFLYPTPVGSYYAISSTEDDKSRRFLKRLLLQPKTPALNAEVLMDLMEESDKEKALELLHHCQKLGWVQGVSEALD
ncbi:MAG: hypothetical protein KAT04_11600, partial [Methylococcales bacterium]|nr:hypothetical protein [Methylococcales bacterium]